MMQGNFNIQISADASSGIAAANATADALKKTADATSKLADESERYQQTLESMAQRQATAKQISAEDVAMTERATARKKDLAERAEYAAQAQNELAASVVTVTKEQAAEVIGTEKAVSSKKTLLSVMRSLGSEFPILGSLGRAALNPVVAAVTLAIGAFTKLRGDIQNLNASLTTSEWESYSGVVAAQKKAAQDAALATAAYAQQMERLALAQSTVSEAAERTMTVFKAQMNAEDRLDEARKRVELTRARAENDPAKRAAKELEIEERYAARKLQRDEHARNLERTEQHRKLANEEIAAQVAGDALAKALERQKALKSEEAITKQLSVERGRLAETESELKTKQKRYDEINSSTVIYGTPTHREWIDLAQEIDQLTLVQIEQRAFVRRLESEEAGKIAAARGAAGDVQYLQQQQQGAIQRANGIRAMLPTQEAVWSQESQAARGVGALDSMARRMDTPQGALVMRAAGIANSLRSGAKVSAGDKAALDAAFKELYGFSPRSGQAMSVFAGADNDAAKFGMLANRMAIGGQVREAAAAGDAVRAGRGISQEQANTMMALAKTLTGVHQSMALSASVMSRLNDSVQQFNAAVTAIDIQVKRLERRQANMR